MAGARKTNKYPLGKVNTVAMESWLRLQNKYMGINIKRVLNLTI